MRLNEVQVTEMRGRRTEDGGLTAELKRARTAQSFCVPKADIAAQGYDLSLTASMEVVHEEVHLRPPKAILKSLGELESEIEKGMKELEGPFGGAVPSIALGEIMATKSSPLTRQSSPTRSLIFTSIPADKGAPEVVFGSAIGSSKQVVQPMTCCFQRSFHTSADHGSLAKCVDGELLASGEWIVFAVSALTQIICGRFWLATHSTPSS